MQTPQTHYEQAAILLRQAQRIVALTGAGISTESGIPDFRSPDSIFRLQPSVSYPDFISKPEARRQYWATRRSLLPKVQAASPNPAHLALMELEHRQQLLGLVTQNFDGLHLDAGHDPTRVVEIHGTSREAACTLCGARAPIRHIQALVDAGDPEPQCPLCGGYMKAATILFGQHIPTEVLARAKELAETCDLFLVVGSSLLVAPAAHLPHMAIRNGIPLVIINLMPTPLDNAASAVIQEKAGLALPRLIEML